jgi:GNAT superfamily N-acetyltransferase
MKTTTIQLVASPSSTHPLVPCRIVAADHPSLDRDVEAFLANLPFQRRSLSRGLSARGGFRLAAIECGRVVGLARVDERGELHLAVAVEQRRLGIGTQLGRAALERAIELDYSRVAMRTTRRSRAARCIGEAMGCIVVENARGTTDLIAHLPNGMRSA